jgi:H+-transporting ATPase
MTGEAAMGEQAIDFSKAPVLKVLAALGSDPKQGLVSAEAASRLAKFGPNALEEKKTSQWAVLFGFFWGRSPG